MDLSQLTSKSGGREPCTLLLVITILNREGNLLPCLVQQFPIIPSVKLQGILSVSTYRLAASLITYPISIPGDKENPRLWYACRSLCTSLRIAHLAQPSMNRKLPCIRIIKPQHIHLANLLGLWLYLTKFLPTFLPWTRPRIDPAASCVHTLVCFPRAITPIIHMFINIFNRKSCKDLQYIDFPKEDLSNFISL